LIFFKKIDIITSKKGGVVMELSINEAYQIYKNYIDSVLKKNSVRTINNHFLKFILPYFKNKKIKDIKNIDILNWKLWILKKDYSRVYCKNIYITFVCFYSFGIKYLDFDKNIVSEVGFKAKNNRPPKEKQIWSLKEYNLFIKKVDDLIYKNFFEFLFFTGCRLGEILALTFNDIEKNKVIINKAYSRSAHGIDTPKTESSNREILLDFNVLRHIKGLKRYYISKYGYFNNNFYIFGGEKMLSATEITRRKNKACELAKVKQITLHEFRHSHITFLINSGMPVTAVAKRVGHKDISMTLNTYSHATKKDALKIRHLLNLKQFLHPCFK
jgi:integrase